MIKIVAVCVMAATMISAYDQVEYREAERGCVDIADCKHSNSCHDFAANCVGGNVGLRDGHNAGSCFATRAGCSDKETVVRDNQNHFIAAGNSHIARGLADNIIGDVRNRCRR